MGEGAVENIPADSVPAGPPPAMRIVEAAGKDVCRVLNAATDSSWEPCRVQRGDVEVVPVAIIKVEYETEVVEEGVTGLMVTLLRPSSRPVAEPRTSSKWSDG